MPHSLPEAAFIAAALLSAATPADRRQMLRTARSKIPPWLPFAAMLALATASLIFGILNPELIAASFGEVLP